MNRSDAEHKEQYEINNKRKKLTGKREALKEKKKLKKREKEIGDLQSLYFYQYSSKVHSKMI